MSTKPSDSVTVTTHIRLLALAFLLTGVAIASGGVIGHQAFPTVFGSALAGIFIGFFAFYPGAVRRAR